MTDSGPLLDLVIAARQIPMSPGALRTFLHRHRTELPPRYRRGPRRRRIRVLTAEEVVWICEHLAYPDHGNHRAS